MSNDVWLILAVLLSCAIAQEIELKDSTYKDNKTSCTTVLISGYDVVEFTCVVDYSHHPDLDYVIFQTKMASEDRFILFTDCNIKEYCNDSRNAHGRQIGKDIIEITVRLNATTSLNGAKLRGLLYTKDHDTIYSSEKIFPVIKDLTEAEVTLIINGDKITPSTECHEVITRPELNIVFLCESQVSSCLIEISTDDSNETSQGVGLATRNKEYASQTEVNVLIMYGVCNSNRNSKSVSCKLKFEYKSTTNESACINNQILSTLCSLLAAMMIMMLLFMLPKRYKEKIFRHLFGTRKSHNVNDSSVCNGENGALCKGTTTPDDEFSTDDDTDPQNLMHDFMFCLKKQKHASFIPINKLSNDDLPHKYGTTDLFYLIKCIAELTVKVTVAYTSTNRPEFYPGTGDPYPFYENRRDTFKRFGTGLVKNVIRRENEQTCPCYKCLHSDNASNVWGRICIATSKSSVFDDSEAQKTKFKIHFEEENGRVYYVKGSSVTQSDIDTDQCEVECVTCDEGLLNGLYLKLDESMRKMDDVNAKYNEFKEKDNLTIIVSHPHGCPKHVSFGHWTCRLVVGTDCLRQYTKYVYTTPTCPGCIGAFVYILGASDIALQHHVHCGVYNKMLQVSSTGME